MKLTDHHDGSRFPAWYWLLLIVVAVAVILDLLT